MKLLEASTRERSQLSEDRTESVESVLIYIKKITKRLDDFEIHLITYQDKVRKVLAESWE